MAASSSATSDVILLISSITSAWINVCFVVFARSRATRVSLTAAATFLRAKGYEVIASNHHSREGELDLVARSGEMLVFVEVKARRAGALVDPLTSVTPAKQRKVVRAALDFVQKSGLEDLAIRFDVIAVVLAQGKDVTSLIEHFEGAFDASCVDEDWGRR